ncbi:hypothetical protein AMTR_s00026p00099720, partial [Amborella trichopoda]
MHASRSKIKGKVKPPTPFVSGGVESRDTPVASLNAPPHSHVIASKTPLDESRKPPIGGHLKRSQRELAPHL